MCTIPPHERILRVLRTSVLLFCAAPLLYLSTPFLCSSILRRSLLFLCSSNYYCLVIAFPLPFLSSQCVSMAFLFPAQQFLCYTISCTTLPFLCNAIQNCSKPLHCASLRFLSMPFRCWSDLLSTVPSLCIAFRFVSNRRLAFPLLFTTPQFQSCHLFLLFINQFRNKFLIPYHVSLPAITNGQDFLRKI